MLYIEPSPLSFHLNNYQRLSSYRRWKKSHRAIVAAGMVTALGLAPRQAAAQVEISTSYVCAAMKLNPRESQQVLADERPLIIIPKKNPSPLGRSASNSSWTRSALTGSSLDFNIGEQCNCPRRTSLTPPPEAMVT